MYSIKSLIFLLLIWWTDAFIDDGDFVMLKTPQGYIRGLKEDRYFSFEGIPYGAIPFFAHDRSYPHPNRWDVPFNATTPAEPCLQWNPNIAGEDKVIGTQDCLTVSVYRPSLNIHQRLPVVVEIHGGFFMTSGKPSDPRSLMYRGKTILVKFNYRVGPLGFMAFGEHLQGNIGLHDQLLALKWVKANIGNFMGNANNITVIGIDAGAASVHLHLLRKEFDQLASSAISFSGNALDPWVMQQDANNRALELSRILQCDSKMDAYTCLSHKDPKDIVRASQQLNIFENVPTVQFGPVVEDKSSSNPFITENPADLIKRGDISSVPWIISYVKDGGEYFSGQFLQKQYDGRELLDELNSRWYDLAPVIFYYRHLIDGLEQTDDFSRDIRQFYLGNDEFGTKSYDRVRHMFTDILFKNATQFAINLHRKHGKGPVYAYLYEHGIIDNDYDKNWVPSPEQTEQIPHGLDYTQIFGGDYESEITDFLNDFAASGIAKYHNCELVANRREGPLELLHISGENCKNLQVDELP